MLISRPSNSGLKRLINIQKCHSSTKLDHCALRCCVVLSQYPIPVLLMKTLLISGVGCEMSDGQAVTCGLKDSYKSVVYRHNNEPLWNELVHIILDPESYPTSHLRFTFRHRSRHSYPKPIAMSFLKLVSDVDDTAIKGNSRQFSSLGFQADLTSCTCFRTVLF